MVKDYLIHDGEIIKPVIQEGIEKGLISQPQMDITKADGLQANAMRFRMPFNWNSNVNPDTKMFSGVSFTVLRQFALVYPIARACINRRIRQMTQLQYDIVSTDEEVEIDSNDSRVQQIKQFFKEPMGNKTRLRELISIMVDDTLTIDATCFEFQRRFNGELMYLVPVDPTTIVLQVTDTGAVPAAPLPAYKQYIGGRLIASFTTDEMIYEAMNPRSYTPYGLAPLESLLLQVESALRGGIYNLNYFKEGNVPEGFVTLPEEEGTTLEEVRQYQEWFDTLMAGDPRMQRRLKILPHGSEYIAAKKPEDMAFEKFEMWLLQQTCAVFDVQPQDIGITLDVNRASGETQQEIGKERGLYPLANYLKEIFDDLIQVEMGFTDLQFVWINIDPTNELDEITVAEKEIKIGALSVDEYRKSKGLDPIGLDHYVMTAKGPVLVKDLDALSAIQLKGAEAAADGNTNTSDKSTKDNPDDVIEAMEQAELKKWRTCIYNDLKENKPLRKSFKSDKVRPEVIEEISNALEGVTTRLQAKYLFDVYVDPRVKSAMELLGATSELRRYE